MAIRRTEITRQDHFDLTVDSLTSPDKKLESRINVLSRKRLKADKWVIASDREAREKIRVTIHFLIFELGWQQPPGWAIGDWVDRKGQCSASHIKAANEESDRQRMARSVRYHPHQCRYWDRMFTDNALGRLAHERGLECREEHARRVRRRDTSLKLYNYKERTDDRV